MQSKSPIAYTAHCLLKNRSLEIAKWKFWLSYLMELHVESASTEYNPHLYVSLRRGRYQLSTANAVYSYGDLYDNFAEAFVRYNWDDFPIDDVLVLGLGLGSIPVILEQVEGCRCDFTAVEIDEVVIDLADRYVLYELKNAMQLICADASVAVQQFPDNSYDLICVDLFDDDVVPEVFEQEAFLQELARLAGPDGVILFNRLAANKEDRKLSQAFFDNRFKSVFPDARMVEVSRNYMLVNRPNVIL